jgi:hypothetical protein
VFLVELYARSFEEMQQTLLGVFSGGGGDLGWDEEERRAFQQTATENISTILPLTERLLHYVHQRTVQRLTLAVMQQSTGQ